MNRTRNVYPSDEIAHRWANSLDDHPIRNGRSDNVSSAAGSLFSYWSQIGLIVRKGECALLNTETYSVTTTKHQGWARRALSHYQHVFGVDVRHGENALSEIARNPAAIVENYLARAVETLERAERARADGNRPHLQRLAVDLLETAERAKRYFKLGRKYRKPFSAEGLAARVRKLSKELKAGRDQANLIRKDREARDTARSIERCNEYLNNAAAPIYPEDIERVPMELKLHLLELRKVRQAEKVRAEVLAFIKGESNSLGWEAKQDCPDGLKAEMEKRSAEVNAQHEEEERRHYNREAEAFAAGEREEKTFSTYGEKYLSPELLNLVNERRKNLVRERLEAWIAGHANSYGFSYDGPVMLRARADMMETTKGARVPLADAERTFRFVIKLREKGWHKNGETHTIGGYSLDAVNEFGVISGCHRVDWSEIERFARSQGWIP